jgi:hypothetical protein
MASVPLHAALKNGNWEAKVTVSDDHEWNEVGR